jgi:phosphatidylglycerophosphate synthase
VGAGYRGDIESAPIEGDEFVIPATDAASRRYAEDRLLQSLLKATDGLISRNLNRRISLRVTRLLLETSMTPNQMTAFAALFGVAAIWVVLQGGANRLFLGALLLQIQSILDGCDGELSRLKYIRSRLGEWLDQILDDVVNVGFFAAAGWALYQVGSPIALPVTIAGTVMHLVYQASLYTALITRGGGSGSVASIRWWSQRDPHAPSEVIRKRTPFQVVKESVEVAGHRDFFTFLYLPAALLHLTEIPLIWCAIVFIGSGATTSVEWILRGGPRPVTRT